MGVQFRTSQCGLVKGTRISFVLAGPEQKAAAAVGPGTVWAVAIRVLNRQSDAGDPGSSILGREDAFLG